MLITLFRHKKRRQRRGCGVAVLVLLSATGLFFVPAIAEEDCAIDFFSPKNCWSFDATGRGKGQNSDAPDIAAGAVLWSNHSRFSGSQIWHRNPSDSNLMSTVPGSWEALGNQAIHGFRCLTDLFGNVVCNRNQSTPKVPLDKTSSGQR